MKKITPKLSKAVGWDDRELSWPDLDQVDTASDFRLLEWYRFLHAAKNEEQRNIMTRIMERLRLNDE